MKSKLEFITLYVLAAAQGYAAGRGNLDVMAILDDAEHFYDQMQMRYSASSSAKVSKKVEE